MLCPVVQHYDENSKNEKNITTYLKHNWTTKLP